MVVVSDFEGQFVCCKLCQMIKSMVDVVSCVR